YESSVQASVHMVLGLSVWVRVVPQRRGGLIDLPVRCPRLPGVDHLVPSSGAVRRQMHSVPVHARGLRQRVLDVDGDLLTAIGPQRRSEEIAVEPPGAGGSVLPGELARALLRAEVESADSVLDVRVGERWE